MYLTLVTLHVLAAIVWLGGVFFLGLVGAPALRRVEPAALRRSLFDAIGMRFRYVGWGAVLVLLVTGTWILQVRGWLSAAILGAPEFWRSGTGAALAWKLSLVTVMLVLSLVHDIASSPARRSGAAPRSEASPPPTPRWVLMLARVGALLGVGTVVAAVRLVRS